MRTRNSVKNIAFGLLNQIIFLLLNFAVRTVFLITLGVEYLGINGLFTNIITILSLADLGIIGAMTFSLYKPIKENDEVKLKILMTFYKGFFRKVSASVLIIGLVILPFLPYIIKDSDSIPYLNTIYILFVLNSVVSYLLVYKRIFLVADQKNYIVSSITTFFTLVTSIVQIVTLLVFKNFILYTVISIASTVLQNLYISKKVDNLYPFLKEPIDEELNGDEKKTIFKNTYSAFLYRIASTVINGTDSIVISAFIGISYVGLYSNYLMITTSLNRIMNQIFNSLTASVGDLNVNEAPEKKYSIFNTVLLVAFWLYGVSLVSLWQLTDPFITLWIGEEYLLDKLALFAIVLNFFINGMHNVNVIFRDGAGLYQLGKYRPIYAAIINIVVSIFLAKYLGVAGVLFGTIISRLATFFWYDPMIIFRESFKRSSKEYFYKYFIFLLVMALSGVIIHFLCSIYQNGTLFSFLYQVMVCLIVSNLVLFLYFRKKEEFKVLVNLLIGMKNRLRQS
ncbi:hypothetical protein AM500_05380 [Bacillus sp. FJAT-18017]|uniref:lipopolysaccharide biosynthesis protein n=1 Tax=Bacillus sp. FJAT-18017 TaxID=1705566 RepID=UPI0006AE9F3F|nr:hypothetical protein [Bacillus sp. FJAT-18017]ALC89280.1 hypothetical protein AM500_05380 [Bacillus sp. FJAT-18017]